MDWQELEISGIKVYVLRILANVCTIRIGSSHVAVIYKINGRWTSNKISPKLATTIGMLAESVPVMHTLPSTRHFAGDLQDLGLSVRTMRCLQEAGINTINELFKIGLHSLIRIRGFGRASLSEIIEALKTRDTARA